MSKIKRPWHKHKNQSKKRVKIGTRSNLHIVTFHTDNTYLILALRHSLISSIKNYKGRMQILFKSIQYGPQHPRANFRFRHFAFRFAMPSIKPRRHRIVLRSTIVFYAVTIRVSLSLCMKCIRLFCIQSIINISYGEVVPTLGDLKVSVFYVSK